MQRGLRTSAELHVIHSWRAFPEYSHPSIVMATDVGSYEQDTRKVHFEQLDKIEAAGANAAGAHLKRERPAEVVAGLAPEISSGLIVVGSRGLGLVERMAMGSTSKGIVDLASCSVPVVAIGPGQSTISAADFSLLHAG